jgi:hypothetical protein
MNVFWLLLARLSSLGGSLRDKTLAKILATRWIKLIGR